MSASSVNYTGRGRAGSCSKALRASAAPPYMLCHARAAGRVASSHASAGFKTLSVAHVSRARLRRFGSERF
eukprot:10381436-Alexandrium_andersonii.AAC.1